MRDLAYAVVTYGTGRVETIKNLDDYSNRDGLGHYFYRKNDVIFIPGREVVRIDFVRSEPKQVETPEKSGKASSRLFG